MAFHSIDSLLRMKVPEVPVECAEWGETIVQALDRMKPTATRGSYSQLAVVSPSGELYLLTAEGIAHQIRVRPSGTDLGSLKVCECAERAAVANPREDLFRWFDALAESAGVLVAENGTLKGIATNYDVLKLFRHLAQEFIWIEEIERYLRKVVVVKMEAEGLSEEVVKEVGLGKLVKEIVLKTENRVRFSRVLASVAPGDLDRVPELRNQVFHFKRLLEPEERSTLERVRDGMLDALARGTDR